MVNIVAVYFDFRGLRFRFEDQESFKLWLYENVEENGKAFVSDFIARSTQLEREAELKHQSPPMTFAGVSLFFATLKHTRAALEQATFRQQITSHPILLVIGEKKPRSRTVILLPENYREHLDNNGSLQYNFIC